MVRNLGGDRLGSGNKMQVAMHNYNRSTHNPSALWKSSMACGTLVPFMSEYTAPADTWDIDLEVDIQTEPTLGDLYGSYKVQLDVFWTPVRLYNSWLHNNKLKIGMNMAQVRLPTLEVVAYARKDVQENDQVSPSSILKYVGISGIGAPAENVPEGATMSRTFNAIPVLAYWDIFKNYYANKQEDEAYVIHTGQDYADNPDEIEVGGSGNILPEIPGSANQSVSQGTQFTFVYSVDVTPNSPQADQLNDIYVRLSDGTDHKLREIADGALTQGSAETLTAEVTTNLWNSAILKYWHNNNTLDGINLTSFPLANIDQMREDILAQPGNTGFDITANYAPYNLWLEDFYDTEGIHRSSAEGNQEGLALKAYQSDLFNNWLSDEFQDQIATASAISTASGSFTMDQLNLADKMYNMLNRVAVSGGSYDDWVEALWSAQSFRRAETPVYCGGLIKELVFQSVISTSTTNTAAGGQQPLGQRAGMGVLSRKHKGGKIQVKATEHGYITGIISLTPRLDYSQGNKWDMNLLTMDDFHKPALDQIGFQDLITEQMAWYGSTIDPDTGTVTKRSAGKQPAWLNYMTEVNRSYGNFAIPTNEMFMTLNRQYEYDGTTNDIKDITTYIDPTKYNNIFAETKLDSQNFRVQIGKNITLRRMISSKLIPNL